MFSVAQVTLLLTPNIKDHQYLNLQQKMENKNTTRQTQNTKINGKGHEEL